MTTLYFSRVSRVYIMASKRKFCEHCEEYVTLRTHRLLADLYCHKTSEEIYSSEEEEIAGDDFEDVNVDRNISPGPCVISWAFHEHLSFWEEI